jgi:NADPH:quinone reductase-like Zn-dependent oxidoreductase
VQPLRLTSLSGPDGLELVEVPEPARADGTVLIDVHAVGVSFVDYARECMAELARLADAGRIRPLVGHRYALADGRQALRDLAERRAVGKLVIDVRPDAA